MQTFIGSVTKYAVFFFNLICLIFGLLCIIFGAAALSYTDQAKDVVVEVGRGPAILAIIVGASMFVICFFGCYGAIKENHCMLVTFGSIVLLLVIVEFVIGGVAYHYRSKIENLTVTKLQDQIRDKDASQEFLNALYNAQEELKCCGASGPEDWKQIPPSCCSDEIKTCSLNSPTIYKQGCISAVKEKLGPAMKVLGSTVIIFASIQLLGAIASCCIASAIKRRQYDNV